MTDNDKAKWLNDNDWNAAYEAAAVDAQYYAALTEQFYIDHMAFDFFNTCGKQIKNVVHFSNNYANAFWDGTFMVYGDGNGYSYGPMSGGQDIVTHELTHGVTECRAPLDYVNEPGALNEAFSDIMATAAEWDNAEPLSSNCRLDSTQTACPDWWLGEDVDLGSAQPFRSLANPALEGQPSHFSGAVFSTVPSSANDYGHVHGNSGIANHAFYLMVNGGRNARCSGPSDSQADCDVVVPAIGMAHAEQIMYTAWGLLTNKAAFCFGARRDRCSCGRYLPRQRRRSRRSRPRLAGGGCGSGRRHVRDVDGFDVKSSARTIVAKPGATAQCRSPSCATRRIPRRSTSACPT